jgi:tRNA pseudouridine55 synthase
MIEAVQRISQDPFHGLLLVDKATGCSSHDVVARARRIMGTRAVGHAGTLDPIASGLLILLVGEATKLSNYILNGDKGYEVKVRLGVETDTLDREGHIIRESEVNVSDEEITKTVLSLTGSLTLLVPKFSAVKVEGKTLYKEARQGNEVVQPEREMKFYDVEVLEIARPYVRVGLKCSKGSYIRAWTQELGQKLGCGASVDQLRRTLSSPYLIERASTLEQLESQPWQTLKGAVPMANTLENWPTIYVEGKDQTLLKNGQLSHGLKGRLRVFYRSFTGEKCPGVKVLGKDLPNRRLLALLEPGSVEGDFQIARVINNTV